MSIDTEPGWRSEEDPNVVPEGVPVPMTVRNDGSVSMIQPGDRPEAISELDDAPATLSDFIEAYEACDDTEHDVDQLIREWEKRLGLVSESRILTTCWHCGTTITQDDHGSWIDSTGGDGCDPEVHEPVSEQPVYEATHQSVHDSSPAMFLGEVAGGLMFMNEEGDTWVSGPGQWVPIPVSGN